jgi:hypothetical protein
VTRRRRTHLDLRAERGADGLEDMEFSLIRRLVLMLALCTRLAAQDPSGTTDGGCRKIAGQVPRAVSTFGHGLAMVPRNTIRPSNLEWEFTNRRSHRAINRVGGRSRQTAIPLARTGASRSFPGLWFCGWHCHLPRNTLSIFASGLPNSPAD